MYINEDNCKPFNTQAKTTVYKKKTQGEKKKKI